jgi:hypothetical protein
VADGDMDAEELEMMKMMGIPVGFDSTKGKHVPDADVSGVRAVTKRQPRQYMNRRGGFNRPLPPERNRWGGEGPDFLTPFLLIKLLNDFINCSAITTRCWILLKKHECCSNHCGVLC